MPAMAPETTRSLLAEAARRAADYLETLDERSVGPDPAAVERLTAAIEGPFPEAPGRASEIVAELDELGSPATAASAGGRYFGFVIGGALPVTVAAQNLAAAWDQNAFSAVTSPAAAAFEFVALSWLKQALCLPEEAEGTLTTGATMANFTCLAAARNWLLGQAGWDVDRDGLFGAPELTVILGEEAHATVFKVLSMLGLGRERVVRLPVDAQGRILPENLPEISGPTVLCLQAGNVNSGAFDPAPELISWAHDGGAWVHVDGAFGLWALAAPELKHLAAGYEQADSWATDAHKWLNVPYDCGLALVRNREAMARVMAVSGAYLMANLPRDTRQFTPESSRRARGIEVWAALKFLGRQGLAKLIAGNCRQARRMGELLSAGGVEVMNEIELNQVVASFGEEVRTREVIKRVQDSGVCWCGETRWHGKTAMRISFCSWATTDEDVERSAAAILEAAG